MSVAAGANSLFVKDKGPCGEYPIMSGLEGFLGRENLDAYLIVDDSACNPDLLYITGFLSSDRFAYVQTRETDLILVSEMEVGRARKEGKVDRVKSLGEYNFIERAKELGNAEEAYTQAIKDLLDECDAWEIGVPHSFPYYLARHLNDGDRSLEPFKSPIAGLREVKSLEEIGAIEEASRAAETAIKTAIEFLESSRVEDGMLYADEEQVTSEMVRGLMEQWLAGRGYDSDQIIVAPGEESANPHWRGEGPIEEGVPIVIDVFPRNKATRYYSDMTRTISVGQPDTRIIEMYEAVEEALCAGISAVEPGVRGSEVHDVVNDVLEARGFDTLRQGKDVGFIHTTGHGVGLAVHEDPSLSPSGKDELRAGNVVTIEPGLYYPGLGGVRLEDVILVTESGHRVITSFERRLILGE